MFHRYLLQVTVNEDSDTNEEIRFLMEPHQDGIVKTLD